MKLICLYVLFFFYGSSLGMYQRGLLRNVKQISLHEEDVSAYYPPKDHITLKKLSREKSIYIFPRSYSRGDRETLYWLHSILQIIEAFPSEEEVRIGGELYEEKYAGYDFRPFCEYVEKLSVCDTCSKRKEKKLKKAKSINHDNAHIKSNNSWLKSFFFLSSYSLFCFGLGGASVLLYNHYLKK